MQDMIDMGRGIVDRRASGIIGSERKILVGAHIGGCDQQRRRRKESRSVPRHEAGHRCAHRHNEPGFTVRQKRVQIIDEWTFLPGRALAKPFRLKRGFVKVDRIRSELSQRFAKRRRDGVPG